MPKKMDRGEPKKECPSCGLGVSPEANICEFCGWDFEEEDEWILQIEKLERELLLEKQKFEPGSVGERIESTLRTPAMEMAEAEREAARSPPSGAAAGQRIAHTAEDLIVREPPPAQSRPEPVRTRPEPVVQREAPTPVQAPAPVPAPAPAPRPQAPEPAPARAAPQEQAPPDPAKIRKVRSVRAPAEQTAPATAVPSMRSAPVQTPEPAPQRQPQGPALQERKVKIPEPETTRPPAPVLPERKIRTVRKVKG